MMRFPIAPLLGALALAIAVATASASIAVHAKLADQRARIAANNVVTARVSSQIASSASSHASMHEIATIENDLRVIDRVARSQRQAPALIAGIHDDAAAEGVSLVYFHERGGTVEMCGNAPENRQISAFLRRLQRRNGVHDVQLHFIEREWDQWCYDLAPPNQYGFLVNVRLDDAS